MYKVFPMMLPTVLEESPLQQFNFYDGVQVAKAVVVANGVYRHIALFSNTQRNQAYKICMKLTSNGYATLITVSEAGYRVWVDVRCKEKGCITCSIANICRGFHTSRGHINQSSIKNHQQDNRKNMDSLIDA